MFMGVKEDQRDHKYALMEAMDAIHGMGSGCYVGRLRELVIEWHPRAYRRAFCEDPPA